MLEVFFSPTFFNSVHQVVNDIIRIATVFLTFGVVVYIIAMVFKLTTKESDDTMYRLVFVVSAAIGLATYRIWAVWIGKIFVLLARAIFACLRVAQTWPTTRPRIIASPRPIRPRSRPRRP